MIACRANITRSPYVRGYMKHHLKSRYSKGRRRILLISAGIDAQYGGGAGDVIQQVARRTGFSLRRHRTYPLDKRLVGIADAILVMEQSQKRKLVQRFPEAEGKTYRLTEFMREDQAKAWDIPDPTGKGELDYMKFLELAHSEVERICKALERAGMI